MEIADLEKVEEVDSMYILDGIRKEIINKTRLAYRRKPEEPKHTTYADRFRSMTNNELAVTLPCPNEMGLAEIACDHSDGKNCYACLMDWLNQPEEG